MAPVSKYKLCSIMSTLFSCIYTYKMLEKCGWLILHIKMILFFIVLIFININTTILSFIKLSTFEAVILEKSKRNNPLQLIPFAALVLVCPFKAVKIMCNYLIYFFWMMTYLCLNCHSTLWTNCYLKIPLTKNDRETWTS